MHLNKYLETFWNIRTRSNHQQTTGSPFGLNSVASNSLSWKLWVHRGKGWLLNQHQGNMQKARTTQSLKASKPRSPLGDPCWKAALSRIRCIVCARNVRFFSSKVQQMLCESSASTCFNHYLFLSSGGLALLSFALQALCRTFRTATLQKCRCRFQMFCPQHSEVALRPYLAMLKTYASLR